MLQYLLSQQVLPNHSIEATPQRPLAPFAPRLMSNVRPRMRPALLSLILSSVAVSAAIANPPVAASSAGMAADPIAQLVGRLSATHGLWHNGLFPSIDLPAHAPVEQVLSRVFQLSAFNTGRVSEHHVLQARQIEIPGEVQGRYTALLVQTNLGRKIVILKFSGLEVGWWSRVYDVGPA